MQDLPINGPPSTPLRFFEEISAIPRGSRNERAIADYLVAFADAHGLWHHRDAADNVIIKKCGSQGANALPAILLQGHTDMVCEKNADTVHDFSTQPLSLFVTDGRLRAHGTTLGADDGIAIAYMLALLEDDTLAHPPLECVFTTMEEIGLLGARQLDASLLKARRMINLDSSTEGDLLASAAGGQSVRIRVAATVVPAHDHSKTAALRVRGLQGGHSGCDIEKERANANRLMGRLLTRLSDAGVLFELADLSGGGMSNAIPREADAVLCLCADWFDTAEQIVAQTQRDVRAEYAHADPNIRFEWAELPPVSQTFDSPTTKTITRLLHLLPNGRQTMSVVFPNLVTLSLNQAVVSTRDGAVVIEYSLRGAMDSALRQLSEDLVSLATLLGGTCESQRAYPPWEYRADSPLRDLMRAVYQDLRGRDSVVQAVHGGVECGILAEKIPDLDVVSIGPNMENFHTPDEWLDLASFDRTYEYLSAVLERLTR